MKKMMIAAGAAATMALFANAATSTSFGTGTGFENLTVGANLNTQQGDETGGGGSLYWYSSAAEDGAVDSLVAGDDSNKYLSVDESEPLYRKLAAIIDSSTGESPSVSLVSTNVYFQADVQFTASDATDSTDLVTTGDKILVWLQGTEAGATNLIITAATSADDVTAKDYVIDLETPIDTSAWYTLRIEAVKSGESGLETAAFTVKLATQGGTLATLASETTTTFYSLVAGGFTGADTISCAGFKGTGAIDNLDFGSFEAEVVVDPFILYAGGENVASVTYTVDGGESIDFDLTEGQAKIAGDATTLIVTGTAASGYTITGASVFAGNVEITDAYADGKVTITLTGYDPATEFTVEFVVEAGGSKYPSYVTTAEAQAKYTEWATKYSYTGDGTGLEKAFLLDIDPAEADTAEFKITAISITADGKVTITPAEGNYKNGKVTIKQYSDPAATKESETGTFFKAVLESL